MARAGAVDPAQGRMNAVKPAQKIDAGNRNKRLAVKKSNQVSHKSRS
jgi:hypothetical protein